jgi:proton glutamate symport protein
MKFSLGYQVLVAVVLGILFGLFFGPLCNIFSPVATAFTMLVQMVVLPYILFSLIHGLGSISMKMGKHLLKCGLPYLILIWALVLIVLKGVEELIPTPVASYVLAPYMNSSIGLSDQILKFLVPENPIYDLANNVVPAIAVFGLIVGLALMQVPKRDVLCNMLEKVNGVIEKILVWLAIISPIGAFAHIAIAVGTVRFEDLYKLEFYVVCFVGISLYFTFVILPILLSCMTPLSYREVIKAFRFVCLIPFVTALSSLSVPFLNTYLLRLSKKHETHVKFHENAQTVLPLAYSFGQVGNAIVLFFIAFLSFYYRHPLEDSQKTLLSFISFPISIGSSSNSVNAISFLIDQFKFPTEGLNLFMETSSITSNFQVLMSIASVLTIILITIYGYYGVLKIKWAQLLLKMGSALGLFFIFIISIKSLINISDKYENLYPTLSIAEVIDHPVEARVLKEGDFGAARLAGGSTLEQILSTGVLKVGYNTTDIPYCYLNNKGELSGYDMAYAYQLARDLDCKLEFVPLSFNDMGEQLNGGGYDIAMAAVVMNEERLKTMNFTHHYSIQNVVLIVTQERKKEFLKLDNIIADKQLKIGVIGAYSDFLIRHFPNARIYQTDNVDPDMMKRGEVDAWIWGADPAMVWCVSNPDFITIDYGGLIGKTYFSYAVPDNAFKLSSYLNNVLILKELSGFQTKMHNYWIKGEPIEPKEVRWSILRNVLHRQE